ncbi:AMP-binding protein [Erwinia aphidicola]|uniref:AMP-binding protein n=1 Tax=Erwinia aphidicola TaxID=68334 RepID=UPI0030D3348D
MVLSGEYSMLITLLEQWADQRPEQPALTNESRSWNWREYRDAVFSIAAQLSALNIRRLALAGNNSAEWAIFDLACIHSGIVCIPVPPFFPVPSRAGCSNPAWQMPSSGRTAFRLDPCGLHSR